MQGEEENKKEAAVNGCSELLIDSISEIMVFNQLEEEIASIGEGIKTYYWATCGEIESSEDCDLVESLEFCLKKIESGDITKLFLADLHHSTIFGKSRDIKEKCLIALAEIYLAIAHALFCKGDIIRSWNAACRSRNYLSYLLGMRDPVLHAKHDRASAGGKKKAANAVRAKDLVVDVIRNKKPKRKWRNAAIAVDEIIDTVIDLIKEEALSLPAEKGELTHYLINLIMEDEDAKKAYLEKT